MIHIAWIVALLLLVNAALAEDLSKLISYAVVYGAAGPGPTQDLSKLIGYAVVVGGAASTPPPSSRGFGSLSLGIN